MSTSQAGESSFTIYVCPKGHWHGAEGGLWAKPQRCPRCIQEIVRRKPVAAQKWTTTGDVNQAPMTEPVEVKPV